MASIDIKQVSGQAVVSLGFQLDKTAEVVSLTDGAATVDQSVIVAALNAPCRHTHNIVTKSASYVDRILKVVAESGNPDMRVRVGVITGEQQFFLPVQNHIILNYRVDPFQDGHMIVLETADVMAKIMREKKTKARQGKISAIVEAIASENQLKAVVEPTQDDSASLYIQSREDDMSFIIERLLMRALNAKGRGSYRLFVKDNVLHFHTADYHTDVRRLNYFSQSPASGLILSDNSQMMLANGAAGAIGVVHDPYTGVSKVLTSEATKTLNFARVTPNITGYPRPGTIVARHLGTNRVSEAQAIVQNSYELPYSGIFSAELKLEKVPSVQVNDVLDLVVAPDNKSSPWSGPYSVTQVAMSVSQGAMVSAVQLRRGEMNSTGENFKGLEALGLKALLARENFATGELVNLGVIIGSRLTSGDVEKIEGGGFRVPVKKQI